MLKKQFFKKFIKDLRVFGVWIAGLLICALEQLLVTSH